MVERELELRLRAVARELDAQAPAFQLGRLRKAPRRRIRGRVVALACVAVLASAAAVPAVSALQHLFDVDGVTELGPLAPGVAPPFEGRSVSPDAVQSSAPFRVWTIPSLGAPDGARVRDDIAGGMVTLVYRDGGIRLTEWRTADVHARIALVPVQGAAEDVMVADLPALWVEGAGRGTFTLVGADGTVHRESFEVGSGALLWRDAGMTFLLQGARSREDAIRLAAGAE